VLSSPRLFVLRSSMKREFFWPHSSSVDLPSQVPIVPMSVKVPVEPMLYIDTLFEFAFVT